MWVSLAKTFRSCCTSLGLNTAEEKGISNMKLTAVRWTLLHSIWIKGKAQQWIHIHQKYVFIVNLQLNPHWCEQRTQTGVRLVRGNAALIVFVRECVATKTSVHNHEGPGLASSMCCVCLYVCAGVCECMYTQFTKEVVGHYKHHYKPLYSRGFL